MGSNAWWFVMDYLINNLCQGCCVSVKPSVKRLKGIQTRRNCRCISRALVFMSTFSELSWTVNCISVRFLSVNQASCQRHWEGCKNNNCDSPCFPWGGSFWSCLFWMNWQCVFTTQSASAGRAASIKTLLSRLVQKLSSSLIIHDVTVSRGPISLAQFCISHVIPHRPMSVKLNDWCRLCTV